MEVVAGYLVVAGTVAALVRVLEVVGTVAARVRVLEVVEEAVEEAVVRKHRRGMNVECGMILAGKQKDAMTGLE